MLVKCYENYAVQYVFNKYVLVEGCSKMCCLA